MQYLIEFKTSHMGERMSNQLNLFGYAVYFAQNMFLGKTRAQEQYRNSIKSEFRDKILQLLAPNTLKNLKKKDPWRNLLIFDQ